MFFKKNKRSTIEAINVVDSISKSKTLFKTLIKKAHPDLHPDSKNELATDLTELLNEHRYNYQKLVEIKLRIENEL